MHHRRVFVGALVASVAGGAAAEPLAQTGPRGGFHDAPDARGVIGFAPIGERMLAWDTSQIADDALVAINTSPPSSTGITGDVPEVGVGAEIEYGEDGILYVIDTGDNTQLHRLDPNTGAYLGAITLTFPPEGNVITSMVFAGSVFRAK